MHQPLKPVKFVRRSRHRVFKTLSCHRSVELSGQRANCWRMRRSQDAELSPDHRRLGLAASCNGNRWLLHGQKSSQIASVGATSTLHTQVVAKSGLCKRLLWLDTENGIEHFVCAWARQISSAQAYPCTPPTTPSTVGSSFVLKSSDSVIFWQLFHLLPARRNTPGFPFLQCGTFLRICISGEIRGKISTRVLVLSQCHLPRAASHRALSH